MRKVYISKHANEALIEYLKEQGYEVVLVGATAEVDEPISCHPDIYMCDLSVNGNAGLSDIEDMITVNSSNDEEFRRSSIYHVDPSKLTYDYPGHAIFNACSTGKYFIHNLKITEPSLFETAKAAGLIPIHVPQGYAKCSIVVVDENSIITADRGIEKSCTAAGLDVLLIEKGQVVLDGYPYGFIGGASGKLSVPADPVDDNIGESGDEKENKNIILFNGDVRKHSDFKAIKAFIEARGLEIKYFENYPLTDIGSIIEEREEV